MKAERKGDTIIISDIWNESQLETVTVSVKNTGCEIRFEDNHTKAIIVGKGERPGYSINKFIHNWNKE